MGESNTIVLTFPNEQTTSFRHPKMNTPNPYQPPDQNVSQPPSKRRVPQVIGIATLMIGLIVLGYGVVGFWLIPSLPPNGGIYGRIPSVSVMVAGMVTSLLGLMVRDFASRKLNSHSPNPTREKSGIPTRYGLILILTIVIIFIVVIARS